METEMRSETQEKIREKEQSRRSVEEEMRGNERELEERPGSHPACTNCHSEAGGRVCFREQPCCSVLRTRAVFLSPPPHPHPPV